jgi:hypothetical protein
MIDLHPPIAAVKKCHRDSYFGRFSFNHHFRIEWRTGAGKAAKFCNDFLIPRLVTRHVMDHFNAP